MEEKKCSMGEKLVGDDIIMSDANVTGENDEQQVKILKKYLPPCREDLFRGWSSRHGGRYFFKIF